MIFNKTIFLQGSDLLKGFNITLFKEPLITIEPIVQKYILNPIFT